MNTEKMFEFATRSKLRFPYRGNISVEDLWDLSVTSLDTIYKNLNAEAKQISEESLLQVKTKEDEILAVKIEIVKHIVNVKLDEANAKARAKAIKEQKQKIMEIISEKEDEALKNKTPEELKAMLNNLEA